ncbi:MAG TPA: gamma-glutamylcyclotransferase [Bacillota bacterium]|jgi:gamma-glutamylcyclotransferase (GGCT)/AIG2-like uncharacterized protein YtfP|nr:gamma-glutamylcyclotransferase [Bacillota bacterium]
MQHKVYVYGTLRPGKSEIVEIPGELRDIGSFPGAVVKAPDFGKFFKAEPVTVDDAQLRRLDSYEGYREDRPDHSLYLRVPYLDGWIYVFNQDMSDRPEVPEGDWLAYRGQKAGGASAFFIGE